MIAPAADAATARSGADTMVPTRYRVVDRVVETADTASIALLPVDGGIPSPLPGQFTMVYAVGIGEVPISVSAAGPGGAIVHTIRAVGAVSAALAGATPGQMVGLRGPFGTDWGMPAPTGSDLLLIAGGIGLAPLRPVIRQAVAQRGRYRDVTVLVGARTPADLIYGAEYDQWRGAGIDVRVTVDRADAAWAGHVGVVTTLLTAVDPGTTVAFVCGPEVMMRFAALALTDVGIPAPAIRVSLERTMLCGVGICGHCQLGPLLVCRDGPVVSWDRAQPLVTVKER
jgi:anaerobic sulfite reductase subunit B